MEKILLYSLGSRGDIEPFLAKGAELQEQGHPVAFCFPAQFESVAKEVSPIFFPMSKDFLELMDDPEVKKITGQIGSWFSRLQTMLKLIRATKPLQQQLIEDQKNADHDFQPDRIIFHIKCVYPIIKGIQKNAQVELLSPVPCTIHAHEEEPAVGFGNPKGAWWNTMTYRIANYALVKQAIIAFGNPVLKNWGWKPLKASKVKTFLLEELSVEYAISNKLFPRPNYWPDHAQITRFRERNKTQHWSPPKALLDFLEKHPKPLYVGFGSMVNSQPEAIGRAILETAKALEQPVLINSSWGGILIEEELPDWAFVVSDIPYDWLFSRVCAVVHHGGSGTTHSALRFDVPQLIIPHIGDQFMWSRRLQKAGLGVEGFPIKDFSQEKFHTAVTRLLACV